MRALLEAGLSGAAIARRLGITKSAVSYHKRRLGSPVDVRCTRRYDWAAVQLFYDRGHPITSVSETENFAGRNRGRLRLVSPARE